ncbi:MAG: PQQ-binding-like beta-propeller repeat protein [Prosthecobacter sp.]
MKSLLIHLFRVSVLAVLLLGHTYAADWPQFHGPARNNTTTETGWSKSWPEAGPPVAWRAQAGMGMASFAVVNGRVFTLGNDGDNQDTVWCLDLATGGVLWRHDYPCKSPAHVMPIVPGGPSATPCVGEGRVYTVSREGDLFCLQTADGKVLWQKSLTRDFGGKRPVYGYAGSPLLWQGKLFLDVGGDEGSTLCLDAATGRTIWAVGKGEAGYSTPVIATLGGGERLVVFKGRELVLLDPADGSAIAAYATTTTDFCNCATPAIGSDGTVFISHTGSDGSTGLRFDGSALVAAWNIVDLGLLYNSGVPLGDNALVVFNDSKRGVNDLRCLDLASGRALWESAEVAKGTAILSDGHLIVLSTTGELQLCLPSKSGIQVLAKAQVLEGKCWVLPVLSGGHLLCRSNAGEVVCLKLGK